MSGSCLGSKQKMCVPFVMISEKFTTLLHPPPCSQIYCFDRDKEFYKRGGLNMLNSRSEKGFLTCREPRNRFQRIDSASLCSMAGRYDSPIPTRFLAPIDWYKIPHNLARYCIKPDSDSTCEELLSNLR